MINFIVCDLESPAKSPAWWNKFSHSVWKVVPDYLVDYHSVRNAELAKYGGKFYSEDEGFKKYVSFKNDRDATFFILRWS
jgi:hypothetical protein